MKKTVVLLSLSLILAFGLYRLLSDSTDIVSPVPRPSVTQSPTPNATNRRIPYEAGFLSYEFIPVSPDSIAVYSNLDEATDSGSFIDQFNCSALVSAGFYTREQTHLGQFVSQGITISTPIDSTLVDGFLFIRNASADISFDPPKDAVTVSVQSGPVVRFQNTPRPLKIANDEFARRIIGGIHENGDVVFMVLFDPDETFSGPKLEDVPDVVDRILKQESMNMKSAMNLDGGSASVFYASQTRLSELTQVGGFFCISGTNTVQ